jgi:hypothetical protein
MIYTGAESQPPKNISMCFAMSNDILRRTGNSHSLAVD